MKKYLLLSLIIPAIASAQANFGLFDGIELRNMQASAAAKAPALNKGEGAQTPISVFMRVSDDATVDRLEAAGAVIEQREGNILIVRTTAEAATALAATEGVVTASLPKMMQMHDYDNRHWGDDVSRTTLGLDKIQTGATPLTQAYTGKGVIVGMVDAGVDIHHINFLDAKGEHRVKRAWKHIVEGKAEITITADTPEKIAKFTTDNAGESHGTHTMGIAAGSYYNPNAENAPDFRGAAPEADIVVSCGYADNKHLIKGVRSIIDYAKSEGKPCVINISMGSNTGPHDGTDEFPAALSSMIEESGAIVCVSSGNEGNYPVFMYHDFDTSPTFKTVLVGSNYITSVAPMSMILPQSIGSLQLWGETDEPLKISVDLLDTSTEEPIVVGTYTLPTNGTGFLAPTDNLGIPYDDIKTDFAKFNEVYTPFSYIGGATSVYAGNNRFLGEMTWSLGAMSAELGNRYWMSLRIEGKPGNKVYLYGMPSTGPTGASNYGFRFAGAPGGYSETDCDGSISALAGVDKIITVGAYNTNRMVRSIDPYRETIGATSYYSSWGHTPGGRLHPLINAPGSWIASSMSTDLFSNPDFAQEDRDGATYYSTTVNGREYAYTLMSGTSMSSPYMAGVAAMWLSADPTLTVDDIVRIAQETSDEPSEKRYNDGASGNLNAFKGLCSILGLSGLNNVSTAEAPYSLLRSGNVFTIEAPAATTVGATLHSLQGAQMLAATEAGQSLTLDASALTPGIYVLTVSTDNSSKSEKIVIK